MFDPERLLRELVRSCLRRSGVEWGQISSQRAEWRLKAGLGLPGAKPETMELAPGGRMPPTSGPKALVGDAAELSSENRRREAMLLVRAMIVAAVEHHRIDVDEESALLKRIQQLNLTEADRRVLEREMRQIPTVETLLSEVRSPEEARRFYAASMAAVGCANPTGCDYLHYLRLRLRIDDRTASRICSLFGLGDRAFTRGEEKGASP
ncbi:MAG TPA: DUF533 domain-containing protein [Acidobacteriota bacterium]|nr:DUF533 domain-containing protein [Acidobacteriota bacterium]HRR55684.1 DUF533 domain-containing protein [Acidobacteriota bacterium]HRV06943.1 DUF533 domain-containing protein [Acidobacteriota bacterium]